MVRQVMKATGGVTLIEGMLVRGWYQEWERVMQTVKKPPRMGYVVIQGCCSQRYCPPPF
jgi:hypothetical protein